MTTNRQPGGIPASSKAHRQRGVTLMELMIVLVLMGVIATLAVPSFRGLIERSQLRQLSTDLITAIKTGRADAVNLRDQVSLAPLANNDWSTGWVLDYSVGSSGQENKQFQPGSTFSLSESNSLTDIRFRRNGTLNQEVEFTLCLNERGREVNVSLLGRITSTEIQCP